MQTNDSRVPEVLQDYNNQAETPEGTLSSIEPIPFKRKKPGKYWHVPSGVQPDNRPELRTDVDQHAISSRTFKIKPVMKYSDTGTYPVYMGKLVTVVNLLLLAYNYDDERLYNEAGLAFGAQINYTLMPNEPEIQAVKLRKLRHCLIEEDFHGSQNWCLHEYPRTMEYFSGRHFDIFLLGLREALERRWIFVPRVHPVLYRIEVE